MGRPVHTGGFDLNQYSQQQLRSHREIQAPAHALRCLPYVCPMFYWNQEGAAYCGQSQVEGNGSPALVRDTCQKSWKAHAAWKEMYLLFFPFTPLNDGQQRSAAATAARAAPNRPHTSSGSHLPDRDSPPPPKFPQRSWKNRLTATSITFSNRCLCSSSALNASP